MTNENPAVTILGMKPWTPDEISELTQLSKTSTLPKIAEKLCRTQSEVRYQLRKHNLKTTFPWKRSFEDVSAIKKYSDDHGVVKAAEFYDLTVNVVKNIRQRYKSDIKGFSKDIDPVSIANLRAAAMKVAQMRGRPDFAQDFASYAVISRLTHNGVNLKWLWATFSKENFGNYSNKTGAAERQATSYGIPITDEPFDESGARVGVSIADTSLSKNLMEIVNLAAEYEVKDRVCFILYLQFGFTYEEIGIVLGTTSTSTHLRLKKMMSKIRSDLVKY